MSCSGSPGHWESEWKALILWSLLKAASLELMFRFCLLHLPSLLFIILLEHKTADIELEEEIQSVLHEALHSQPGNALTLKNEEFINTAIG